MALRALGSQSWSLSAFKPVSLLRICPVIPQTFAVQDSRGLRTGASIMPSSFRRIGEFGCQHSPPRSGHSFQQCRRIGGYRASISLPRRSTYARMYPTLVVYPDGSTVTVRYPQPRGIIKLPLLLDDVKHDPELKRSWELRRLPKEKYYEVADQTAVKFDPRSYIGMVKPGGKKP